MAKANTFKMEKEPYFFKDQCLLCDKKPEYRGFYYPTYFNGDAELVGDFCEEHKDIDLKELYNK